MAMAGGARHVEPSRQPEPSPRSLRWSRLADRIPGFVMLRGYHRAWLSSDLVAGLVLTTLLVPQGMAYAELAGLPAVTGLYTTIACLVAYAVFGPSRILVLGPDSAVSPLILAAITPLLGSAKDPATALKLAGMLALLVGVIEIGLGVAKLGFVADLLSKEVKVGYMNGLAVVIIVGQLPKLFGFSTDASGFVDEVHAFFANLDLTVAAAVVTGLACLVLLFTLPHLTRKVPAILVVIVGATIASELANLSDRGVKTVGALPQGLPHPTVPWTKLSDVGPLFVAAVGITLVSLTDTIATSASFAARRGETVSADKEMIGVGTANLATGFFQGFAISSSASRTAVADSAKAKTQVTGLVGAAGVVLLLLFFNSVLAALPQPTLAAVVVAAAISLADLGALRRYWQVRRSAVLVSAAATAGVIFFGVLDGILLAIGLSILLFFRSNWWPHGTVLALRADHSWHAVDDIDAGTELPGIVVFRWEAPLFFANSGIFRRQVWSLVKKQHARWVILQCEAITDIDVTAADMLEQLDNDLDAVGVHIAFAELRARLHRQVARYGLLDKTLDREHFYDSIDAAVADITRPTGPVERGA
jgi:high affinity sulfate transporter 1